MYEPPPNFGQSFSTLPARSPADRGARLAWAVKNLKVDDVRDILEEWPRGATMIDKDDNTLFHLAASQPDVCKARPEEAKRVIQILLERGWEVVDLKNRHSERAEVVATKADPNGVVRQLLMDRSRNFQEPSRVVKSLRLVGEDSPVSKSWQYVVADDRRRSWAGILPRSIPASKCRAWMGTAVHWAPWEVLPDTPRKVAWFVSADYADTPYRYSGLEYTANVFPPWMEEIRKDVCHLCGIPPEEYPNSCNVNLYEDQSGEVGWHSDDEVMFQSITSDTRIISFSLGAARDFCWRLQGTTESLGCVPLGDGDVMTMEGLFQKHYKHSVPASAVPCGPRINFTFRWIRVKAHAADAETK